MEGDPFDALTEAIGLLREASPETDEATLRREAHMRKVLRAARRAGHERIAVVCGAWHAPALAGRPPKVAQDNARLKGMAKARTSLTWVPGPRQMVAWSPCGVEVSLRTRPAASEPWNCSAMSGIC